MRIIGETHLDFMGRRNTFLALSAVLVLASIGVLFTSGIQRGVEFSGGAQVILRYVEAPGLNDVRRSLSDAGLEGVSVTTSKLQVAETEPGQPSRAAGEDLIIRLSLPDEASSDEASQDLTSRVMRALHPQADHDQLARGLVDLNVADQATLTELLANEGGIDRSAASDAAELLVGWRRTHGGVFTDMNQVTAIPELSEQASAFLGAKAFTGAFGLRGQEFIEASVSKEMRDKALWAIVGALAGMLIYIWIRFQFQWGLAAIIALVHDTLITLGAFSLAGMEANLPVVAAFLTLVGYSVNDTIVVFDRVRENLRNRAEGKLEEIINRSINQTISRTLITSMTTWMVVAALFLLGGMVIRPFAFVLLVGIIVGTYSSIFIASPILLFWQRLVGSRKATAGAQRKRAGKTARLAR